MEVGAKVEAPDWNPEPECGGGLYCLPNAKGDWDLLHGHYWAVLEFDEKDMVQVESEKCKVKNCKIIFLSKSRKGMIKFFDYEKFDSETAYLWAFYIGNKDIMIDRITESVWAYCWAKYLGNKDIMINRITKLRWARLWYRNIWNEGIMQSRFPNLFTE